MSDFSGTEGAARRRGRPPGPQVDRTVRRGQLLEAAAQAIRRDGARVSMESLAAEAGVTKPVLYAHFGDKAGLTRALADRFTTVLTTRLLEVLAEQRDEEAMVRAAVDSFLAMVEDDPQLFAFMLQHGLGGDPSDPTSHQRQMFEQLGGQVSRMLEFALRSFGQPPRSARPWAYAILGAMLSTADWWIRDPKLSRQELVDDLMTLFWHGLSANEQPPSRD
ncbi:MAG TPA: TetR/AcrR family transcriptional regulator [Acidimicrobiales bacterium]|nr:TetR/AcrR family transcriptional regulator [Acidimicrobiales bacterium]